MSTSYPANLIRVPWAPGVRLELTTCGLTVRSRSPLIYRVFPHVRAVHKLIVIRSFDAHHHPSA
jgi:hypothetical protein